MNITERMKSWTSELQQDLTEARNEFAAALKDVAAAESALKAAVAERDELHAVLRATNRPIPAEFGRLMTPLDRTIHEAQGRDTQCRERCAGFARRVADLEDAMKELNILNGSDTVGEEAA